VQQIEAEIGRLQAVETMTLNLFEMVLS